MGTIGIGYRHERIEVIGPVPYVGHRRWMVLCDCGTTKSLRETGIRVARSCGCLHREITAARNRTHGQARRGQHSPTYTSWRAMIERCYSKGTSAFAKYGALGIRVCPEWHEYDAFLADMGERPSRNHSIDRRDGALGYSKSNCRWATSQEQCRNLRTNVWLEHAGERLVASDWAKRLGVSPATIHQRLKKCWPVERVCTTGPLKRIA